MKDVHKNFVDSAWRFSLDATMILACDIASWCLIAVCLCELVYVEAKEKVFTRKGM